MVLKEKSSWMTTCGKKMFIQLTVRVFRERARARVFPFIFGFVDECGVWLY